MPYEKYLNIFNMYVLAFIVTLLIIMSLPIIAWRPIILSFVLILLRHIIYLWLHIYILATIVTLPHVLALAVLLWYCYYLYIEQNLKISTSFGRCDLIK